MSDTKKLRYYLPYSVFMYSSSVSVGIPVCCWMILCCLNKESLRFKTLISHACWSLSDFMCVCMSTFDILTGAGKMAFVNVLWAYKHPLKWIASALSITLGHGFPQSTFLYTRSRYNGAVRTFCWHITHWTWSFVQIKGVQSDPIVLRIGIPFDANTYIHHALDNTACIVLSI